ncbi:MAG: hypothetical protein HYX76_08990, partial [Acidobacteria bacterium]|nr:hypothetical protein [Acidobacteriota bacterium]
MRRSYGLLFVLVAVVAFRAARAQEETKWDVTAPLGPTTTLEFDTSEGTWMNL